MRHYLIIFFLSLFNNFIFAQNTQNDSSLFPLAIGNQYLYFYNTADTNLTNGRIIQSYSIGSSNTTTTIVIDSMLFFNIGDFYYSYNNANSTVYSAYYDPNYHQYIPYTYANLSQLGTPILQNICGDEQPCYKVIVGGPPTSDIRIGYFCYNFGLGYYAEYMPIPRYYNGVHHKWLIGIVNADSANGFIKQDESAPVISSVVTTKYSSTNILTYNLLISHKYSFKTDPINYITGCSFVSNAKLEYFYKKDNDELVHQVLDLNADSEIDFSGDIEINNELLDNGYELYYKISATDKALMPHTTYFPESGYEKWDGVVGVKDELVTPQQFSLKQNYPNPFNPSTTISFYLPKASFVNFSVYNIIGQKVADLVNQQLNSGEQNINFNASHLNSGVYIYKLITPQFTDSKKMLLMK